MMLVSHTGGLFDDAEDYLEEAEEALQKFSGKVNEDLTDEHRTAIEKQVEKQAKPRSGIERILQGFMVKRAPSSPQTPGTPAIPWMPILLAGGAALLILTVVRK